MHLPDSTLDEVTTLAWLTDCTDGAFVWPWEADMNRRQFTVEAAMLLLGGATITISACGGGSSSSSAAASTVPLEDNRGAISNNHGHTAVVTAAQEAAGGGLDLDMRGTASHTHTLSLTGDEVTNIRLGAKVTKDSTGGSHTHTVTFNG